MKNQQALRKMIGYIDKILRYCECRDYGSFSSDNMLVDACVFNLSQIGELVQKLDVDFRTEHTDIPWRQMSGLRNRIVHDYEGVNLLLVWDIVTDDLPELHRQLSDLH